MTAKTVHRGAAARHFGYTRNMRITTLFIDVDDTLYPKTTGIWDAIGERMNEYIHRRLAIPLPEVASLRQHLYAEYGTTLRGLQQTHGVDAHDFLAYVHDIPVAEMLSPNPALRQALQSLPQRRIIFTNSDQAHTGRVLTALDVQDCFEQVIDIHAIHPYCKPMAEAFAIALQLAGSPPPAACLLADDNPGNIAAARRMGFTTVYIGAANPGVTADATLDSLVELPAWLHHHRGTSLKRGQP